VFDLAGLDQLDHLAGHAHHGVAGEAHHDLLAGRIIGKTGQGLGLVDGGLEVPAGDVLHAGPAYEAAVKMLSR